MLEVEVPAGNAGDHMDLAAVDVSYLNMHSKNKDSLSRAVAVSFSASSEAVAKATDKKVMESAVQQVSNEMSKEALRLHDSGKVEEAKQLMKANTGYLADKAVSLGSAAAPAPALAAMEAESRRQAYTLDSKDDAERNVSRKKMKEDQFRLEKQQR